MTGIDMSEEEIKETLDYIDEKINQLNQEEEAEQVKAIEERLTNLRKKTITPVKTRLESKKNELLHRNNTDNFIVLYASYLIDEKDIEVSPEEQEIITTAVDWWVEQINNPKLEQDEPMLNILTKLTETNCQPVTVANIEVFRKMLSKIIAYNLQYKETFKLETYKTPSIYLEMALYLANIDKRISYWSSMEVSKEDVLVKQGYGVGKYTSIFQTKKRKLS